MPEFTESQIKVLAAIADTVVAPLTEQEESVLADGHPTTAMQTADVSNYSKYSGSSIVSRIADRLGADGTFELTGHCKEFAELTRPEREAVMLSWQSSPELIGLYRMFTSPFLAIIYSHINCPAYPAMAYEGCDPIRSQPDYQATHPTERLPMLTREDLSKIQRFDAIIVGTGAGGGTCAAELAAAGLSVLAIEKGSYYHESEFRPNEDEGVLRLFDTGAPLVSEDGVIQSIIISTFGGATTVNFSASLKPPHNIREKWGKDHGISYFLSPQFAVDLQRVYERIGVSTKNIKHNGANQLMRDGCEKLGYSFFDVPRNTSGQSHECNWCIYGCRDGVKNGTMNTWLHDTYEYGAKFLDRSQVTRVLVQDGKAAGVECLVHGKTKTNIYADRVVISAGPIRTPGILTNSSLTNKNIGRNMRIHPTTIVYGIFDEPVNSHEGAIITAMAEVRDGIRFMTLPGHAGLVQSLLPWRGSLKHKQFALKLRHVVPLLVFMCENDSSGTVTSKPDGEVSFTYTLSQRDRKRLERGLDDNIQILCAAGAREIHTVQTGIDPFVFGKDEEIRTDNTRFVAWREKVLAYGLPENGISTHFAPHPMGSCRLGVTPVAGATKPTGETWEVENLYVADASLFPASTGVNPMVSIEALAIHVASNIISSIKDFSAK
ncbi:GMC oxidoreductase-domain-containing protein [Fennellomyces sp. T-0311]|nr:GMC oxidoreductase-domain-containing protein [Fennellomyces sp. T-0311]